MKKLLIKLFILQPLLLCSAGESSLTAQQEPKTIALGSKAPDFSLLGKKTGKITV